MIKQIYDFITKHDLLKEATNFFQKAKKHSSEIIIFFILLIILYLLIKLVNFFFNRQTCIKCDQATRKIWLKINSQLGICYRCISGRIWEPEPKINLKELEGKLTKLDQLINSQK